MLRVILPTLLLLLSAPLQGAGEHQHDHDALREVPAGQVALHAERDPMGGWNIEVRTTDFRFVPEKVNGPHVDGEGHAHVYVDGEKLRRIYGPWFHIEALGPGKHRLKVTLNGHSHEALAVDGEALEAEITLEEEDS